MTLGVLFKVLDTDSNKNVEKHEFRSKLNGLHCGLTTDEINQLFRKLDRNGNGNVDYDELIEEFAVLNLEIILRKMNKAMEAMNLTVADLYKRFAVSHRESLIMTYGEFDRCINHLLKAQRLTNKELYNLRKNFDRNNNNAIDVKEFELGLQPEKVSISDIVINLEDIIKPLASKFRKYHGNIDRMFE